MQDTIREYEASADMIRRRIDELNGEITHSKSEYASADLRELEVRRRRLYAELSHMEGSIAEMREYLAAVENSGTVRMRYVRSRMYA
jgi:flagellar capping protein FliD